MIFQMVKRKRISRVCSPSKKRKSGYWNDFGRSFFGTLGDPVGTIISLSKGQQPEWNRHSGLATFDHRRGFVGNILNNFGMGYLNDVVNGTLHAVNRKSKINPFDYRLLAYKLHKAPSKPIREKELFRTHSVHPFTAMPSDIRKSSVNDSLYNLLQSETVKNFLKNKTVRDIGKKALITTAGIAIPKAIEYLTRKHEKIQKKNKELQ
ncbi:TPA_asm: hypothetical protein [Anelosimus tangle-web spider MELD virus]|nr:TPA_asm: hypothetical protein [Anelosimus tangle-web spider MELD virus]